MPYQYKVSNAVWRLWEGEWYPGKIVEPPEELAEECAKNGWVYVCYYHSNDGDVVDPTDETILKPFEESSSHNVTDNPDMQVRIEACRNDSTRTAPQLVQEGGAVASEKRTRPAEKRPVLPTHQYEQPRKVARTESRAAVSAPVANSSFSGADVKAITSNLRKAAETGDIDLARYNLSVLSATNVTLEDMRATKIAQAVTELKRDNRFLPIRAFVQKTLEVLFQKLPKETLDVLEKAAQAKRSTAEPTRAVDILAESQATAVSATQPKGSGLLEDKVRRIIEPAVQSAVERIVQQLRSVPLADLPITLGVMTSNAEVTSKVLMGAMNANDVSKLTFTELLTEKQRSAWEEKKERELKELENAGVGVGDLTEMFECPECRGNKCRFKEQQTRGADEPTTKWIFCQNTDCKHNWKLE
jgi:DNA-directed RNA polymerase subunit M/transcription elongation factor TFIIS